MKNSHPLILLCLLCALCGSSLSASAQDTANRTPEEIAAAIANVNKHIAYRQTRATELTNDLIRLDQRVENRIDSILETLEGITDSQESQIRVAQMKERAVEGLKKTIEVYDQKRRAIQEETRQRDPRLTREELFSDLGKFDDRIDKRVEQILSLTKTMHNHVDYDKWKTVGGRSWGWGWDNYQVRNPEYDLNRKQVRHTESERQEISSEIDAAIERLESQNRDIDEKLKKDITDKYREMLTYEKNRNLAIIAQRETQKEDLLTSSGTEGDKVGRKQAIGIEKMIEDMAGDLNRDFYQIFNIYRELNEERAALKSLNDQLATLKAAQ